MSPDPQDNTPCIFQGETFSTQRHLCFTNTLLPFHQYKFGVMSLQVIAGFCFLLQVENYVSLLLYSPGAQWTVGRKMKRAKGICFHRSKWSSSIHWGLPGYECSPPRKKGLFFVPQMHFFCLGTLDPDIIIRD